MTDAHVPENADTKTPPRPEQNPGLSTGRPNAAKVHSLTQTEQYFFETIACTYKSKLGTGAFGKVYLLFDNKRQKHAACKIIELSKLPDICLQKFVPREIDIALKVRHPAIIATYSMYKIDNRAYLMMDYAERKDLDFYIATCCKGRVRESQARIWIRQIVSGLEYLHEVGIAHRDVKCENILITKYLNAKLGDFGLSRTFLSERKKLNLSMTSCGTLAYAAPEVIQNKPYHPKTADIWSTGVVLFRILNKSLPFEPTTNLKTLLAKQERGDWRFSSKYTIGLSSEVKSLVRAMLEPSSSLRISAHGVRKHAWIEMIPGLSHLNPDEKSALQYGKHNMKFYLKCKVLSTMLNPMDGETHNLHSKEPNFVDQGDEPCVSEEKIALIVCQEE